MRVSADHLLMSLQLVSSTVVWSDDGREKSVKNMLHICT